MFRHKTLQTSPLKTSSVGYINMKGWGTLILQICMLTAKLRISDFQLVISVAVWRGMDKDTLNVPVQNKVCLLSYLWNKFKIMTFIHWQMLLFKVTVVRSAIFHSSLCIIGVLCVCKFSGCCWRRYWSFGRMQILVIIWVAACVFGSSCCRRKFLSLSLSFLNFCLCKFLW